MGGSSMWLWALWGLYTVQSVFGGYLLLDMETVTQCGTSRITWSGDDGPYHLLLTPTAHVQHGYNVWIPAISNGTNSYDLQIKQPAGMQFVVTMWGASGILYASTTDVMTVQDPVHANSSCFLSDAEINSLYSFSFNVSDTYGSFPPQCENVTISWPTSLESTITSSRRSLPGRTLADVGDTLSDVEFVERAGQLAGNGGGLLDESVTDLGERAVSTSENSGNTTYPPTLFGVIPLGNSFNITISYNASSKYAKTLPASSLSDHPTTWTRQGVTYLNWTVGMAKGTRFLLVAGMSKDEQWASGGSSMLYTVGQGTTDCSNSNAAPSVTASSGESSPTSGNGGSGGGGNEDHGRSGVNPVIRTALASVFSVVGTLVAVAAVWWLLRLRRRRRRQAASGHKEGFASQTSLPKDQRGDTYTADSGEYQLANMSREQRSTPKPVRTLEHVHGPEGQIALAASPADNSGSEGSTLSPTSPTAGRGYNEWNRQLHRGQSTDRLLNSNSNSNSPVSPLNGTWYPPSSNSGHRPLVLHNGTYDTEGSGSGSGSGTLQEDSGDISELKRETLAATGGGGTSGPSPTLLRGSGRGSVVPGQGQRVPRRRDEELEYVVHRDAGRVIRPRTEERRVLELPPRYEELNWESERGGEGQEGEQVLLGEGGEGMADTRTATGTAGGAHGVALGQPVGRSPTASGPNSPVDQIGQSAAR